MSRLLPLVVAFLLAGCAQAGGGTMTATHEGGMPDDFTTTIVYRNGSVAPPHHFEWRLRVDRTQAELSWRPGYDEAEPPWVESVAVTEEQRADLYERLRTAAVLGGARSVDEGLSGGPTGSVEATVGGRTTRSGELGLSENSQRALDQVQAAAEEVVPADVWNRMTDRQRTWGG
ncbi:hypothetical protein [Actinophytocola xanthii]|uniref:Lipoprotein n=1 Tax=Actinophytocola xanthii TaxID=1912961 RepID=A0A1Q8CQZ2_9PSEU|nr:hypothetical protein [Actinophytocola xanthii]OLF16778.1 hypothetical protein BU204_15040 [Actinophytocola xanthii]